FFEFFCPFIFMTNQKTNKQKQNSDQTPSIILHDGFFFFFHESWRMKNFLILVWFDFGLVGRVRVSWWLGVDKMWNGVCCVDWMLFWICFWCCFYVYFVFVFFFC